MSEFAQACTSLALFNLLNKKCSCSDTPETKSDLLVILCNNIIIIKFYCIDWHWTIEMPLSEMLIDCEILRLTETPEICITI